MRRMAIVELVGYEGVIAEKAQAAEKPRKRTKGGEEIRRHGAKPRLDKKPPTKAKSESQAGTAKTGNAQGSGSIREEGGQEERREVDSGLDIVASHILLGCGLFLCFYAVALD